MSVTIPNSPAELEEILADDKKLNEIFAQDGGMAAFTKAYLQANGKKDPDVAAQIREQLQIGMADMLQAAGGDKKSVPVDLTPGGRPVARVPRGVQTSAQQALYSDRAMGTAVENIFKDAAEYFQAVSARMPRLQNREELTAKRDRLETIQNSFGSEVPADGGFLIPEIMRSEILEVALEEALVRPRATVIPMSTLRVPIPAIDDTSHVSSIMGGVVAYWTEEAAALTESQASFQRIVLDAKKLTAFASVPNELLADAPAFMGFFNSIFPRAIAWFEDVAFTSGTGVGEPLGYLNAPAAVQVAAEAGQPTKTIVWENIVKMYARMLPGSLRRAVWVASIDTFPQLATMALSVGTGGGPVWIGSGYNPGNTGSDLPPVTILGRPVLFTEKAKQLGTAGDINFVDFSYYLLGDRQQMMTASSEHFQFQNDRTAFRVIERLDGRPWLQSAITPQNGGPTLTPFVQLASR